MTELLNDLDRLTQILKVGGPWAIMALSIVGFVWKDMQQRKTQGQLLELAMETVRQSAIMNELIRQLGLEIETESTEDG